jgi:PilZ domain
VFEKRVHPRVEVALDVTCEPKGHPQFTGLSKDVSLGGMYIESDQLLPFGTEITILAPFADGLLKLPGVVRWAKPGGFGVQFGLLGARETHVISKLLRKSLVDV